MTTSLSAFALILLLFQHATPPPACQTPEYRQLDFRIGEWFVEDAKGQRLGSSRMEKLEAGCGIQENWIDRTGLTTGGVRQVVERSRDGGRTWTMAFDGRYRPAK